MIGGQKSELSDAGITLINFTTTYTAEQARHLRMIHPVFKASYHPDLNDIYLLASELLQSTPSCLHQDLILDSRCPQS